MRLAFLDKLQAVTPGVTNSLQVPGSREHPTSSAPAAPRASACMTCVPPRCCPMLLLLQDFCSLALETLKSYKPEIARLEAKNDDLTREVDAHKALTSQSLVRGAPQRLHWAGTHNMRATSRMAPLHGWRARANVRARVRAHAGGPRCRASGAAAAQHQNGGAAQQIRGPHLCAARVEGGPGELRLRACMRMCPVRPHMQLQDASKEGTSSTRRCFACSGPCTRALHACAASAWHACTAAAPPHLAPQAARIENVAKESRTRSDQLVQKFQMIEDQHQAHARVRARTRAARSTAARHARTPGPLVHCPALQRLRLGRPRALGDVQHTAARAACDAPTRSLGATRPSRVRQR